MSEFTHINERGEANMVENGGILHGKSGKAYTSRSHAGKGRTL